MYKTKLSPREQEQRAANAVAQLLMSKLIVPKIYLEPSWPGGRKGLIDLLAVDRAGAGDLHIVEIKSGMAIPEDAVARLMRIPAHFKYLALVGNGNYFPDNSAFYYDQSGVGRVGVIQISESSTGDLSASVVVNPERFRVESKVVKSVDTFASRNSPDFEVRY